MMLARQQRKDRGVKSWKEDEIRNAGENWVPMYTYRDAVEKKTTSIGGVRVALPSRIRH